MKEAVLTNATCFNLGPRERQKRLALGVMGIAVGVVAFLMLRASLAPWWGYLVLMPFFTAGAVGLIQWRERTCIAYARQGVRNIDRGMEPIADEAEKRALRARAAVIQQRAVLVGVAATLLAIGLSFVG
jgi:hypothetical protein